MFIRPLCAAGAALFTLLAAPALAQPGAPDTGGPIATQAAVNAPPPNPPPSPPTAAPAAQPAGPAAPQAAPPPAAPPAPATSAAAALRAAVFSGTAQPAAAAPAPAAPATTQSVAVALTPVPPAAPSFAPTPPAAAAIATLGSNANAQVSQTTELAPGLPVKDRTGAVIGQVTNIEEDRKLGQLVTIQMGDESFRLPTDRLGLWGGAATINLSQADIEDQLHRKR